MSRRILVVEDEAPIREMLCFVLEQKGYQAVEAEDYDSAVIKLAEPFPDLVLLDWMLPGGSGINFIKQSKNFTEAVFVRRTLFLRFIFFWT